MDVQKVLRWLVTAIVLLVAIVLLGFILQVTGFLLGYVIKILLILLAVAIVLRFFTILQERR